LPGKDGIGMVNYLILCRSLTRAQRSAAVLKRAGISAGIVRCPKEISAEGCSHCVKIAGRTFERAIALLMLAELRPKRVFSVDGLGSFEEVEFT